ncbi:MAG: ATP-binding cassette domain-containing protein [Bacteroidia bacterium]|nr:ATP-binding cassette domain-containing protein [Bacteroidia bacterium]
MAEPFLRLDTISKAYDQHQAVDRVSLSIPRGSIYGLLGPNGAGKTSIIRMITGITAPDTGQIWFDGEPLRREHTHLTGYMPEERGLYKKMKIREQAIYLLVLKGMREQDAARAADRWLDRLGLGEWKNRNTTDLSKGMQQKVQFIITVAHEPRLLILDEPFSGLDPVNARLIEDEIRALQRQGTTILFSTHRLEQVEEFCDHIALINQGKVMLENDIVTVRKQFQKNEYFLEYEGDAAALDQLAGYTIEHTKPGAALITPPEGQDGKALLRLLIESPLGIQRFEQHLPRLNDIFIELVGGATRVGMQQAPSLAPKA